MTTTKTTLRNLKDEKLTISISTRAIDIPIGTWFTGKIPGYPTCQLFVKGFQIVMSMNDPNQTWAEIPEGLPGYNQKGYSLMIEDYVPLKDVEVIYDNSK